MMYAAEIVMASALVALVLVFIRISWTLKEISDSLASKGGAASAAPSAGSAKASAEPKPAASVEAGSDDTEIAAVIAIAHAALREAV